jgi:hypothetical protein
MLTDQEWLSEKLWSMATVLLLTLQKEWDPRVSRLRCQFLLKIDQAICTSCAVELNDKWFTFAGLWNVSPLKI